MSSSQNDFNSFHSACYNGDLKTVKDYINRMIVSKPIFKEMMIKFLLEGKTTTGCTPFIWHVNKIA